MLYMLYFFSFSFSAFLTVLFLSLIPGQDTPKFASSRRGEAEYTWLQEMEQREKDKDMYTGYY
jgi:hypothetical protein